MKLKMQRSKQDKDKRQVYNIVQVRTLNRSYQGQIPYTINANAYPYVGKT